MRVRCGIDLVELERFKELLQRSDADQMQRIFTQAEWDYCQQKRHPELSLAGRFAAKEACMKLFPEETNRNEIDFVDIEVVMDNHGAPRIQINEKLQTCLERYQLKGIQVSISHTLQYACAIAVTE